MAMSAKEQRHRDDTGGYLWNCVHVFWILPLSILAGFAGCLFAKYDSAIYLDPNTPLMAFPAMRPVKALWWSIKLAVPLYVLALAVVWVVRTIDLQKVRRAEADQIANQKREAVALEAEMARRAADQRFEEAARAAEETRAEARYNRVINCVDCEGGGEVYLAEHPEYFPRCFTPSRWSRGGIDPTLVACSEQVVCPYCLGRGIAFAAFEAIRDQPCTYCSGKGSWKQTGKRKGEVGVESFEHIVKCRNCGGTGKFSGDVVHYRTVVPNGELVIEPKYPTGCLRGYRRTEALTDDNRAFFAKSRARTAADG